MVIKVVPRPVEIRGVFSVDRLRDFSSYEGGALGKGSGDTEQGANRSQDDA